MDRRSTAARARDVASRLDLLLAEVGGYGCKDMTHYEDARIRWHRVEEKLRDARAALARAFE